MLLVGVQFFCLKNLRTVADDKKGVIRRVDKEDNKLPPLVNLLQDGTVRQGELFSSLFLGILMVIVKYPGNVGMDNPSIVTQSNTFISLPASNNLQGSTAQQGQSFNFVRLDTENESSMRLRFGRRVKAKNACQTPLPTSRHPITGNNS